jgi:hypothetical protein
MRDICPDVSDSHLVIWTLPRGICLNTTDSVHRKYHQGVRMVRPPAQTMVSDSTKLIAR